MHFKRIHCIGFWPDYETLFFQQARLSACDVMIFNPLDHVSLKAGFRYWPRPMRNAICKQAIKRYLQTVQADLVVVHEHRLVLEVLAKQSHLPTLVILMRNPVDARAKNWPLVQSLKARGAQVWSFDPADCETYGFQFYRQFVAPLPELMQITPAYDFAFVGRNKGRGQWLSALVGRLQEYGYSILVDIRDDQAGGARPNLTYPEYLQRYLSARCILDINQQGQTGLTLRPLEALFYGRKLVSNNAWVQQEGFYQPNNIFIFDELRDLTALRAFMQAPLQPVAPAIQQRYTVNYLLQALLAAHDPLHPALELTKNRPDAV